MLDLSMDRVFVRNSEPLVNELAHFVSAVMRGAVPRTDGHSALRSLWLAWHIQGELRRQKIGRIYV
jgi:hypothetical protein